jgi:hypothetical protein
MVDVLLRHYPQLAPALNGVQNVSPLEKGAPLIASLLARGRSPGEWPIEQRSHGYLLSIACLNIKHFESELPRASK